MTRKTSHTPSWRDMGLKDDEYQLIVKMLGREPNYTELGVFAVLWSEHCAYKHSKSLLRTLPTQGERVLVGPGENAGVVDIGEGLACAFKIESHNHPSAVQPYEGAATGVGGIVRDILAMGAQPRAVLNSLRLGPVTEERTGFLLEGILKGASDYCNVLGLAGVGGEVWFGEPYRHNPLVNVFCAGTMKHQDIHRGTAYGLGNKVMILGRPTGKDGIHACTFASEELDENTEANVPEGDPVAGKKMIGACLEMMRERVLVGVQDMGAAGIASSAAETAHRAGTGLRLEISEVPTTDPSMTPYEILLSETQERMLLIVEPSMVQRVLAIAGEWGVPAQIVGEVTNSGYFEVLHEGNVEVRIPVRALAEGAPTYTPEWRVPEYVKENEGFDFTRVKCPTGGLGNILLNLLGSPNIASRESLGAFFCKHPQTLPSLGGAGLLKVGEMGKTLVFSVDCNSRLAYLNPRAGAAWAVAESARNVALTGAQPVAITNGLNFGNPEKPEIYWQLKEAVTGMSEACRVLELPVTGGNVSLYNETGGQPIYPAPIVGVLGILENEGKRVSPPFKSDGDVIALLGTVDSTEGSLAGSEYLHRVHGLVAGSPRGPNLDVEKGIIKVLVEGASRGLLKSAQDLSEGGLAAALAECCVLGLRGAKVTLPEGYSRIDALLFGESNSAVVVGLADNCVDAVGNLCQTYNVPFSLLGTVGGDSLVVKDGEKVVLSVPVEQMKVVWETGVGRFTK